MSKTTLVTVLWEDAAYSEKNLDGTIESLTTGVLVREDDKVLTLAFEVFGDGGYRHMLAIPKSIIRRRRDTSVNWRIKK